MQIILSEVEQAEASIKTLEDQRQRLTMSARNADFDRDAYQRALDDIAAAVVAAKVQLTLAQAAEAAAGGPVYPTG